MPFLRDLDLLRQVALGKRVVLDTYVLGTGPLTLLLIRHQEQISVMLLEHLSNSRGNWQAGVKFELATCALVLRRAKEFLLLSL